MSATKNLSSGGSGNLEPQTRQTPYLSLLPDEVLDAMQTGVVFYDLHGAITRLNASARTDLHATDALIGHPFSEEIAILQGNRNILPELLAGFENPETRQVRLPSDVFMQSRDGNARFFVSGCITRLECGGFLLSFRNIVNEMTQEYMLKMALASTKIFPWFYDMERGRMVIDSRYFEYTGIPTTDHTMTLEEYTERLHPDDRETMAEAFTMQLNGEHFPYPVPFRLRRGDDRYEWFEGQSTYLGKLEGIPYRVVGICMSTQAHKNIEEALTQAKNKAEQSERLKTAFLANMSHEIRTPLNAIVGFSNLLAGGEADLDSDDAKEFASLISKNCDHLLTLVSDILDLSRIETDTMEYHFERHSLHRILTEIYRNHEHAVPNAVDFSLSLPSEETFIETDAVRLRQAIDNLLSNALKFTAEGRIELGYYPTADGRSAQLFVTDTGRGIPAEQQEKVFERFYKVDDFVQGAGLGLSICKTITECLGGTVGIASQPQRGSRFTLTLPLRRLSEPAAFTFLKG